jgi:ABC-2 type transport system permease protein
MGKLSFLLEKEFRQIFRNPAILKMMLMMPIIQLILIPLAADYEIKNINLNVVDYDHSTYSRRLVSKLEASKYFNIYNAPSRYQDALKDMELGEVDVVLTIPPKFEINLVKDSKAKIDIAADAVNGIRASLGTAYASQIISSFNNEIREEWIQMPRNNELPILEVTSAAWYNPMSNYKLFMVPGIMAILITMVGSFMTSLNIVSEKEIGTIEQINVTPVKKYQFLLGKLIPFWVIGMFTITISMLVGFLVFGIKPIGSIGSIYIISGLYLIGLLGVGLLVSTFADTQQQATLFAFFMMMIFVLMSGLYTPTESMPDWAYTISKLNPPSYFVTCLRAIYLKGSSLFDLKKEIYAIAGFAIVFNTMALLNYRKRG